MPGTPTLCPFCLSSWLADWGDHFECEGCGAVARQCGDIGWAWWKREQFETAARRQIIKEAEEKDLTDEGLDRLAGDLGL